MNETIYPEGVSGVPWPNEDQRVPVPDTSMLPGSETAQPAQPAAVGQLKNTVQGAHDSIDRLADRAAPAVRKLGESVSAVRQTLRAKTDQLRGKRDVWAEGARRRVRSNPLAWLAGALALGAAIARIRR